MLAPVMGCALFRPVPSCPLYPKMLTERAITGCLSLVGGFMRMMVVVDSGFNTSPSEKAGGPLPDFPSLKPELQNANETRHDFPGLSRGEALIPLTTELKYKDSTHDPGNIHSARGNIGRGTANQSRCGC